jgi:hypothetical protein
MHRFLEGGKYIDGRRAGRGSSPEILAGLLQQPYLKASIGREYWQMCSPLGTPGWGKAGQLAMLVREDTKLRPARHSGPTKEQKPLVDRRHLQDSRLTHVLDDPSLEIMPNLASP